MQQKKHVGEYLLRILFFYEPKSTENIFYKIVEIKMFLYINKKNHKFVWYFRFLLKLTIIPFHIGHVNKNDRLRIWKGLKN